MRPASSNLAKARNHPEPLDGPWKLESIDKCPAIVCTKNIFGAVVKCTCGYHHVTPNTPLQPKASKPSATEHQELKTPAERQTTEHHPAVNRAAVQPPATKRLAAEHRATEHLAAEHLAAEHPAAEHPAAEHLAAEHPAGPDYSHRLPVGWLQTLDKIDQQWIGQHLFASKGNLMSNLKMWWHPPPIPGPDFKSKPVAEHYYRRLFFLWLPRKMWSFDFRCPACRDHPSLTSKGLYNRVRNVIDLTSRYYIGDEFYSR